MGIMMKKAVDIQDNSAKFGPLLSSPGGLWRGCPGSGESMSVAEVHVDFLYLSFFLDDGACRFRMVPGVTVVEIIDAQFVE